MTQKPEKPTAHISPSGSSIGAGAAMTAGLSEEQKQEFTKAIKRVFGNPILRRYTREMDKASEELRAQESEILRQTQEEVDALPDPHADLKRRIREGQRATQDFLGKPLFPSPDLSFLEDVELISPEERLKPLIEAARREERLKAELEAMRREEPPDDRPVFQDQGATWRVVYNGVTMSVRNSKGMTYIWHLLRNPETDIHAAKLRSLGVGEDNAIPLGSAGKILDDQALRQCREQVAEIDKELEKAEANHDLARIESLSEEGEALRREIARATGLFGDSREALSDRERHRKAVSAAIYRALKAIKKEHKPLWQHLENSLTIGEFLSYQPDQSTPWTT